LQYYWIWCVYQKGVYIKGKKKADHFRIYSPEGRPCFRKPTIGNDLLDGNFKAILQGMMVIEKDFTKKEIKMGNLEKVLSLIPKLFEQKKIYDEKRK